MKQYPSLRQLYITTALLVVLNTSALIVLIVLVGDRFDSLEYRIAAVSVISRLESGECSYRHLPQPEIKL